MRKQSPKHRSNFFQEVRRAGRPCHGNLQKLGKWNRVGR
jgi:hypothetical protein